MILITLSSLFFHIEYGSVVWTSILASLATFWIAFLLPVLLGVLSINISFSTPASRFILSNVVQAYDLELIKIIWSNLSSVNICAHVFRNMDFSFENSVSVHNLQFSWRSLCDRKSVLYPCVSGFSSYLILTWVVYLRVRFSLFSPIPHFYANRSALIPLCCLYVYVANPLLVLLTLTLLIILYAIKSWAISMERIAIVPSKSWIPKSFLH